MFAKIAAMPAPYGAMGERLHALILHSAPALQPTVWYGLHLRRVQVTLSAS